MADVRSVVVRLSAETSSYIANIKAAGKVTEDEMGRSEKATKKASVGLSEVEKAGAGGAVALAGMALVASADFEQAMSNVEAATHGTAAEMSSLEQAALDAGKATSFSATEAATGIENLAKAGVEAAEITGGALTGALDLAAAGGLGVADAAEAAAGAMAQFKLEGKDVPHIADLLAAGAGKAQGEVSDMVFALKQAGTVASQTGLSLEETVGALSAMAEQSLLGSDAGTSFKTMLAALTPNSDKARKAMEQYNISAYDAQGNFIGMTALAGQLRSGLSGLTEEQRAMALETIFGSDAVRAAAIVYDNGADGIAKWTANVDDAGYAAETAAIKMDNLKGDVEVLMGSIETALIGSGDSSQDSLRTTTQMLTVLVDTMSEVQEQGAIADAVDQVALVNSDAAKLGFSNLIKVKNALFGVEEATDDAADSSLDKADADALLAAETTRLGSASKFSAEELKAQADALEDARKAAADTAQGFVNLGDSLDDSKVSLGEWISDMANQADALNNFTTNAQKAAKNGLRDGLIAALKDAGVDGAMRMRQLANATDAEIDKANAAWLKGQRAIDRYIEATVKVPKEKSTTVKADARPAFASFRAVDQWLSALDGKRVTTYVDTVRTLTGPKGGAAFSQNAYGDIRNGHQAEIAGGGEWRVWAEDETMGESYIPHANDSRRPRAKRILEETAAILGARSIEWYAGGGNNQSEQARKERERRQEAARREEERRQRQLDNQRTRDLLASNLRNEQQQARLEAQDARRRLQSAKSAGRPRSEIRDAKLALKSERADLADMAEQSRIERKQAEDDRLVKLQEEQMAREEKRQEELAEAEEKLLEEIRAREEAVLDGQQRAWDTLTDAAKSQVDAAKSLVESVEANMDRIGAAATSMFRGNLFEQTGKDQRHGLWTGENTTGSSDWRSRAMEDITGLQERAGLIGQLSAAGLKGAGLEALLGQSDNAGIAALIAKGEVGDYAALFAQREALLGQVSAQAGVAGYGQDLSTAQAGFTAVTQRLDRLNALIAAARPISITAQWSLDAMLAEAARLQGNY